MTELELNELDEARLEIGQCKDEIEQLRTELVDWRQATETLRAAIQATALDASYNEAAIRKAVSFEIAEVIVAERNRALEDKPYDRTYGCRCPPSIKGYCPRTPGNAGFRVAPRASDIGRSASRARASPRNRGSASGLHDVQRPASTSTTCSPARRPPS